MFTQIWNRTAVQDRTTQIERLRAVLQDCDAVVIGAGAGLSTAAGFTYSGERFQRYFADFAAKYDLRDMYSGGFYPFDSLEEYWAYWSRYIWINRYMDAPSALYDELLDLVRDKDYFVLTTNVDHCFQRAGFDHKRLFYTQGDYGLFQCSGPCHQETYDNETQVRQMIEAQGYVIGENNELTVPAGVTLQMSVPTALVPHCPRCGRPMTMNLRADDSFVEDEGWHQAAERYSNYMRTRGTQRVLYLELGVGYNTPVIIKYPFWQRTAENPRATYACINYGEAGCPAQIRDRSICINGDISAVIQEL